MILVNVKSYKEMFKTIEFLNNYFNYTKPKLSDFYLYKKETVLAFKNDVDYSIGYISLYNSMLPNDEILSFKEFESKYNSEKSIYNSIDTETDNVNSPSHYKQFSREVIDTMQGVSTTEEFKGYLKLNAIKYLSRYQGKNGAEDLAKAGWYINKLKEVVENEKASQAN